jgi:glycosidase
MKNKIIIYQLLPHLFGNDNYNCKQNGTIEQNGCGHFSDISTKALKEIKSLGATHVWYTGVIEHATQTDYSQYSIRRDHPSIVKGKSGSPYAIKDYYDVNPDLTDNPAQRFDEFLMLVNRTHRVGLKVVMDFVPNHVARQYHSTAKPVGVSDLGADDDTTKAFDPQNNFYYIPGQKLQLPFGTEVKGMQPYNEIPAKATGNDNFTANTSNSDWYETIKLNYGIDYMNGHATSFNPIPSTWKKMLDILNYWASYGIDAFRCDMAEMVPVDFWEWAIPQVKKLYPKIIFIAEVYNPEQYRNYIHKGHFDYLYNKVGLYDTLRAVIRYEAPASSITQCWQSTDDIKGHLLDFLENHDEQRIASTFFANDPRKGIPALITAATMGNNPFMLYFGQELGESGMDDEGFSGLDGRTTIFDYWRVDTILRWRNNGKYDGALLTPDEKQLRLCYKAILNLTHTESALSDGLFYDLQYANPHTNFYDDSRQYAFLRKYKSELLIIIANFSPYNAEVHVNIPQNAFDYFHISPGKVLHFTDLLSAHSMDQMLSPNQPIETSVPSWGGVILKCNVH